MAISVWMLILFYTNIGSRWEEENMWRTTTKMRTTRIVLHWPVDAHSKLSQMHRFLHLMRLKSRPTRGIQILAASSEPDINVCLRYAAIYRHIPRVTSLRWLSMLSAEQSQWRCNGDLHAPSSWLLRERRYALLSCELSALWPTAKPEALMRLSQQTH